MLMSAPLAVKAAQPFGDPADSVCFGVKV